MAQLQLKHANSILESFEHFSQMSSKSILIILSYTISKLECFLRRSVQYIHHNSLLENSQSYHKFKSHHKFTTCQRLSYLKKTYIIYSTYREVQKLSCYKYCSESTSCYEIRRNFRNKYECTIDQELVYAAAHKYDRCFVFTYSTFLREITSWLPF